MSEVFLHEYMNILLQPLSIVTCAHTASPDQGVVAYA